MKIAFFEIELWEKEVLRKAFPHDRLYFSPKRICSSDIQKIKDCEVLTTFVNCKINKNLLQSLPSLKYIATMSTGYDHIDVGLCEERGVKVSNVPFYGENTVAEYTFALILGLSRKLVNNVNLVKEKKYHFGGYRGFDLKGKTLGVIGGGNIGQHVIRIAKGFGMNILVFDVVKDSSLAKNLGFKYASLETLLQESDIVSLHVPYNKHTHHLINKDNISLMKKSAYLINTSRGPVVDEKALIQALKRRQIAGAGLDVYESEPQVNLRLTALDNVILTPHTASATVECRIQMSKDAAESILAVLKWKKALKTVNPEVYMK
ncbi:hydroxyacid dehydrogenase [Candidatus Woesearchaeota archaeon]|nr:hydroxyacid dehydrogenase [Candidatus Woesearchaeota archaeon]